MLVLGNHSIAWQWTLVFCLLPTSRLWSTELAPAQPTNTKPNIVFILADDLGWADTTLYGHTRLYQTPNIQRLAERGMTFTRAYSASPLCSPTRSAILTGLSPARTGITSPNCHLPEVILTATVTKKAAANQKAIMPNSVSRLNTEYRTLAESLKEAGYATGHFGKWHLGSEPYSPLQQGFDVDLPHHPGPGPAGSYLAPWKFKAFSERSEKENIEDRMADDATAWIEANHNRPFYLNYFMFSVHGPWGAKDPLIEKYKKLIDPQSDQRNAVYAAMIETMDDAVGKLINTLDRLNLSDNTIIVFTSDNGGNMYSEVDGNVITSNRPLRGGKACMYEGGTRVPAVVVWPGITQKGGRSDQPIQSEDYYPTILEGLNLPAQQGQSFDGNSIISALRGGQLQREAIFQFFPHSPGVPDWLPPAVSVHAGDWKLIRIFHGGEAAQHRHLLYNLKDDLGEQTNLASSHPDIVRRLDGLIEDFLKRTNAVVPVANPEFDASKYDPSLEGKAGLQKERKNSAGDKASGNGKAALSEDATELKGWKVRSSTATVKDGILRVTRSSGEPFLGFAAGKLDGQAKLRFRIRCQPGDGKVAWVNTPAATSAESKSVAYSVPSNDWTEITTSVPAITGTSGIVRLFLPIQEGPVEIDWIELESNGKIRKSDF
jgi:arylsulfatase A-like enzyme